MVNGKVSRRAKVVRARREPIRNPLLPVERSRHETRPYPTDARNMALDNDAQGVPMVNPNANRSIWPCRRTRCYWRRRQQDEGHCHAYKRNGGKEPSVFTDRDVMLLSYYRQIHPEATAAEVTAFIWNAHGRYQNPPRFYVPSQITRAEQQLTLSRKRASKTARQALAPRIRNWRWNYWNAPFPYGIADIAARDMIDIDEAVVTADDGARRYGKSFCLHRVRYHGPYSREGGSVRVILGISGDPQLNYRWAEIEEQRGGTTFEDFYRIVDRISADLQQRHPGRRFVFLMDNLNVHHNPLISQLLQARGHAVVYRAPYTPEDGPIEFVFNTLESALVTDMHKISNAGDVRRSLENMLRRITDFSGYFRHVGYR